MAQLINDVFNGDFLSGQWTTAHDPGAGHFLDTGRLVMFSATGAYSRIRSRLPVIMNDGDEVKIDLDIENTSELGFYFGVRSSTDTSTFGFVMQNGASDQWQAGTFRPSTGFGALGTTASPTRYARIRRSGNTLVGETSPNNQTWTPLYTYTNAEGSWQIDFNTIYVELVSNNVAGAVSRIETIGDLPTVPRIDSIRPVNVRANNTAVNVFVNNASSVASMSLNGTNIPFTVINSFTLQFTTNAATSSFLSVTGSTGAATQGPRINVIPSANQIRVLGDNPIVWEPDSPTFDRPYSFIFEAVDSSSMQRDILLTDGVTINANVLSGDGISIIRGPSTVYFAQGLASFTNVTFAADVSSVLPSPIIVINNNLFGNSLLS